MTIRTNVNTTMTQLEPWNKRWWSHSKTQIVLFGDQWEAGPSTRIIVQLEPIHRSCGKTMVAWPLDESEELVKNQDLEHYKTSPHKHTVSASQVFRSSSWSQQSAGTKKQNFVNTSIVRPAMGWSVGGARHFQGRCLNSVEWHEFTHLQWLCDLPHQVVEDLMWCGAAVKVLRHRLSNLRVCHRQAPLTWQLQQFSNCFVWWKRSIQFPVVWLCVSQQSPYWKRERENLKGSHDHPMGGGMLGNYQQNSDIIILCIYFLSNVYN